MKEGIISLMLHPEFEGTLQLIRIIFVIVSLYSLAWIIFLLLRSTWLKRLILEDWVEFFTYKPFGKRKFFKQWEKIIDRLETGREAEYKLAVIEADGFLDDILEKMGYKGETMGDRLKQLSSIILPNLDEVWEAHKIRNNIVHDPDYRLTLEQAKRTLEIYEKSLRDLEVF